MQKSEGPMPFPYKNFDGIWFSGLRDGPVGKGLRFPLGSQPFRWSFVFSVIL